MIGIFYINTSTYLLLYLEILISGGVGMVLRRATEILKSKGNVEVLYNNEPVWLENIDSRTETVYVKSLNNDKRMVVPIIELVENENIGRH